MTGNIIFTFFFPTAIKLFFTETMSAKKPEQKWGVGSDDESTDPEEVEYKIDPTWMAPIEIKTKSKVSFLFKAGNRLYTLDGTSKNGSTSEMALRKKYA